MSLEAHRVVRCVVGYPETEEVRDSKRITEDPRADVASLINLFEFFDLTRLWYFE
jgi:hypothetical protein